MWKLFFKYSDGGQIKVTNKAKEITPRSWPSTQNYMPEQIPPLIRSIRLRIIR
ncbi:MAG: hypothetical protein ACRC3H_06625 [Lachnospiraceae bacterium]